MNRLRKGVAICAVAGMGAFILAGCATLTGGGWMPGKNGGKATFGFNLTCNSNNHLVGDWTYHDKSAGIDIAGTLTDEDAVPCDPNGLPGGLGEWTLPYTAQHCSGGCSGLVDIAVIDANEIGKLKGDELSISVLSGPDAGYEYENEISGGNLEVTGGEQP